MSCSFGDQHGSSHARYGASSADAPGLTPVRVNRVLQRQRIEGLVSLKRGAVEIIDYGRLQEASGFSPNYLHIEQRI